MPKSLILIGFARSGKTTVGKACAMRMDLPFYDLDELMQLKLGMSKKEAWQRLGEEGFRACEEKIVEQLPNEQAIIASGGGTPFRRENQRRLRSLGALVYLHLSYETLLLRMQKEGFPAFLKGAEDLEILFKERALLYESLCDFKIEADKRGPDALAEEIANKR
jgi:shikimate kinase